MFPNKPPHTLRSPGATSPQSILPLESTLGEPLSPACLHENSGSRSKGDRRGWERPVTEVCKSTVSPQKINEGVITC